MATHLLAASRTFFLAHGGSPTPPAPLFVIAILGLAFVVYCLVDLARAESVRYLPRWLWAIICIISIPLGGIIYLAIGKER